MEKALMRFGFFLARVNGTLAWSHSEWSGYRIVLGKRTMRLEHREVVPGVRRKNLRGTWRKAETFRIPETARAKRQLVAKIARIYLGQIYGVRSSATVGAHSPSSVRSYNASGGNAAGGGKVRSMPTRSAMLGWSPAAGRRLADF